MELKVWVEGIQRVVCGVNEKTTCQDVVYALAHATGKTGRFTLIERWRSSERLLAPGEQPLKVLLKFGEHSNDVQFILQWSPLDSSSTSTKQSSPGKSGQSTGNNNNNIGTGGENSNESFPSSQNSGKSYSPAGSHTSSIAQSNGLPSSKKLPYSSAPSYHHPSTVSSNQGRSPSLGHSNNNGSSVKQLSHVNGDQMVGGRLPSTSEVSTSGALKGAPQRLIHSDAIKDFPPPPVVTSGKGSSSPCGNVGKMKELSAPPPYREPPNPIFYQGKVSPSVSSPTGINSSSLKGLPPYREPPPPTMLQQQSQTSSSSSLQQQSQYANTYQLRHSASSSLASAPTKPVSNSQSFFNSSANSSSSSLQNSSGLGTTQNSGITPGVPPSKESPRHGHSSHDNFPSSSYANVGEKSDNFPFWNMKEQQVANGTVPNQNQNGSISSKSTSNVCISADNPNSHYKELVRLVNSQREKLTSQQAELTQYDAEIMFWEGKAKEQQRNMEFITKEISRLEQISSQNESQVLSLAHLEEENEYVRQESDSLKSELTFLRSELGKCENELDKCRSRLRRLLDELHTTTDAMSKRQEDWLQREAATLAEVERLKKELELARRETDAVSDLSGSLDKEVHSLESTLAEKKKQMEQLVSAMKEANLQSLIINPPEEIVDGGVHQRSGSTRRMIGSPRQLENAAPTSKNPHGVWV